MSVDHLTIIIIQGGKSMNANENENEDNHISISSLKLVFFAVLITGLAISQFDINNVCLTEKKDILLHQASLWAEIGEIQINEIVSMTNSSDDS